MDLDNLDFEAMDKEMEAEEANAAKDVALGGDVDEGASDGGDNPTT